MYFIEITYPSKSAQLSYDIQTFIFNNTSSAFSGHYSLLPAYWLSSLCLSLLPCESPGRKTSQASRAEVVNSDHVICPSGGQKQPPWNQRTQYFDLLLLSDHDTIINKDVKSARQLIRELECECGVSVGKHTRAEGTAGYLNSGTRTLHKLHRLITANTHTHDSLQICSI